MKKNDEYGGKLPMSDSIKKCFRAYAAMVLAVMLLMSFGATVFAADDL